MPRERTASSDEDEGAEDDADALVDQYAQSAIPKGDWSYAPVVGKGNKQVRYRRYEKCELRWKDGRKETVGFGSCIKVPYLRETGALATETLLSIAVISEVLVEEQPKKKASAGSVTAPLGAVTFKCTWLYSLGKMVNDFPQYVHHRRHYPENERFFQVPTNDPFGREAKKKFPYDDVLPTSVVSVHRVRFVIDRANIPEDSPGDREDCLFVNDIMELVTVRGEKFVKLYPIKDLKDPKDGRQYSNYVSSYLRRLLNLPWCKEANEGLRGSYELVRSGGGANKSKRRRLSILNSDDSNDDDEGRGVEDDDIGYAEMTTGTPHRSTDPEPRSATRAAAVTDPGTPAAASAGPGAVSSVPFEEVKDRYTVIIENTLFRALGVDDATIETIRILAPVATLLVKKILAENDDRKAFGAKVEELTAVFDKRRGLIQDLRNGAIDLDTLWQDATRAIAQNRR